MNAILLTCALLAGGPRELPPQLHKIHKYRAPLDQQTHEKNIDPEQELIDAVTEFVHDPLGFVMFAFPWGEGELEGQTGPYPWQEELLIEIGEALRRGATLAEAMAPVLKAVSSGHGIGKSAFVGMIVQWAMATHEKTKGIVTANTLVQLRTKTIPECKKWHRLCVTSHWFDFGAQAMHSVDPALADAWCINFIPWSAENPEAFAGLHNKAKRIILIFDEASSIDDIIWETAEGALTDVSTEIIWLVFGNPTRADGRFRECFRRYKHRWGDGKQIDSRTVPGVNLVQIQKWIDDNGVDSDFVKIRVRGIFPFQSFRQLISEVDVDSGYGKHLREDEYRWAPKILTLDNAWTGNDELVMVLRQGLAAAILCRAAFNDNDSEVGDKLMRLEDEHQADAVFIDAGYGQGVYSFGKQLQRDWKLVWFSGKPTDPSCLNKRAEMWRDMRDWLKSGGAIPADPQLRQDLTSVNTVPRGDGKLQLEAKEDVKQRTGVSPNIADALAISFAYSVEPKSPMQAFLKAKTKRVKTQYNPLEGL